MERGGIQIPSNNMKRSRRTTALAHRLRSNPTDAEQLIWTRLRAKQLDGAKFRRQQPIGPYVVDFASFEHNLVVEIDGGQHNEDHQRGLDERRTLWLQGEGFTVMRFWNNEVLGNLDGVLDKIVEALRA